MRRLGGELAVLVLALSLAGCGHSAAKPQARETSTATPTPSASPSASSAVVDQGAADALFAKTPARSWGTGPAALGPVSGRSRNHALQVTAVDYARKVLALGNFEPAALRGDTGDIIRAMRDGDARFITYEIRRRTFKALTVGSGFGPETTVIGAPRAQGLFTVTDTTSDLTLRWRGTVIFPVTSPAGTGLMPVWREFVWHWKTVNDDSPLDSIEVTYSHGDACKMSESGYFSPGELDKPIPKAYFTPALASATSLRVKGFVDDDDNGVDDRVHCP